MHDCFTGQRRQMLEAFVAAFGVDNSTPLIPSEGIADPVLQVPHVQPCFHLTAPAIACSYL